MLCLRNRNVFFETDYSKTQRLNGAGVENRQAAIRGRPKVSKEDAHTIMKIIIAIRGLTQISI